MREPALDCRPYREGELAILVPRGHVLARKAAQRFDALLDFDIVGLHAGAAAHEQMLQRALALGRPLNARMQGQGAMGRVADPGFDGFKLGVFKQLAGISS